MRSTSRNSIGASENARTFRRERIASQVSTRPPSHASKHLARPRASSLGMTANRRLPGYRRSMKDPTSWERLRRVDPLIWDSLLAFAVLGASILGTTLGGNAPADPA